MDSYFFQNNKGFSLIELMVTVSIVATLTAITMPIYRNMTREAKRTEAKLNVKTVALMSRAAIADGINVGRILVSADDFSSDTSCNTANVIGFRMTNCKKVNYSYYAFGGVNFPDSAYALASEGREANGEKRIFTECGSLRDTWHGDGAGRLVNATDMKKFCSLNLLTLVISHYSDTDPTYDLNGSGAVDGADFVLSQILF